MNGPRDFGDAADPVVRRAIDELRRLPAVAEDAVTRVVSAAATARVLPAADEPVEPMPGRRWSRITIGASLVAAAAVFGFVIRGTMTSPAPAGIAAATLIGDFNRWDPSSALMTRSSDGALWSLSIPVLPGRHMYAFMVDDSMLVLDPRAPKARDPDLGAEGSVRFVGRP